MYVKVSAEEAAIFDFLSAQKNKRQMFYYPGQLFNHTHNESDVKIIYNFTHLIIKYFIIILYENMFITFMLANKNNYMKGKINNSTNINKVNSHLNLLNTK